MTPDLPGGEGWPDADLPGAVLAMADRGPRWAEFVAALPRTVRDVAEEWQLTVDGPASHGHCSLVLPVRVASGRPAVLKLGFPDDESEHEHLALQHWHGNGAVELLRADPRRRAMLLERLHPEDLADLWDLEACEVVAGLYGGIHRPALPQLRTLSSYVARWTRDLRGLPRNAPLPRRLVEQAVALGAAFATDDATDGTLVHTDLHYGNVLAAERAPWLVIDPKPLSGDPHYEPAPMLWNRFDELAGDVRDGLRRRFHTLVDGAGLDEDRARDWVVVRMVNNAMWTISGATGRDLAPEERAWLTTCVTVAKAVQE